MVEEISQEKQEIIKEIQSRLLDIAVDLSKMWSVFETWGNWREVRFEFDWPIDN